MGTLAQPPPVLSIDTSRRVDGDDNEPLSPTAQILNDVYNVAVIGFATPIDVDEFRTGLKVTLVRHPRFSSILVMDDGRQPRWVRTTVNLDDHIIFPDLDPAAVGGDPDKAMEDYVASLSTLGMDQSKPLWEFHVLNFPTSEAASAVVFRINHALGDGTSLISLLLACTRSAANPTALPAMLSIASPPPATAARRAGPARHRFYGASSAWPASAGGAFLAFAARVVYTILLAWHTLVDVVCYVALVLNLVKDPRTVFTGVEGVEFRRKRFVSCGFSLHDVKHVKNALGCTINDVLVGLTSAAISRYYFRKSGDQATKKGMFLRSLLMVNELAHMMESSNYNGMGWGNKVGEIKLPFHIVMHDDPIEYVLKAKKIIDRKKHSLEVMITHGIGKMGTKLFGIKVSGALFQRMISNTTMAFSNMIGPVEQIEFYGHRVVYISPSSYGHPSALTIHWQSYADSIRVVLAVDDAQFLDCHQLLDDFTESLKLIRDATSASK